METYKIKNIAGHLAKGFLANPLTPILAFAILLLGYISLEIMPREEDPQIAVSGGSIIVAIPGATPQEISNVIIKPLERRIREIKGVDNIYGTAMNNFGMVNVQYLIGENRESTKTIANIPGTIKSPTRICFCTIIPSLGALISK